MTKIRTAALGATVIAMLASSSAFAQGTPEQRAACMGDAFRYAARKFRTSRTSPRACGQTQADPACKTVFLKG